MTLSSHPHKAPPTLSELHSPYSQKLAQFIIIYKRLLPRNEHSSYTKKNTLKSNTQCFSLFIGLRIIFRNIYINLFIGLCIIFRNIYMKTTSTRVCQSNKKACKLK